ncbi:HAMP domain-containing histidine kinase [Peribacillus sp. TH24]|nr:MULTISPECIES: HAMP domain-containing sensor histidine kinase [unclassified Peribacillus]MBK5445245.1 HAMP domain-containing histidine kinase [Peribacillus sp. TH24]MBK5460030.1 HAMP domain-containing histidine kinase [Peribacillus sp. TH27]MBK5498222.1 HAMP domain-containing histidine kinase [Peribacillus sp. TH14]
MFVCIFLIETVSMIYLHNKVVHSRINQELESLKSRGNSHRDVLEISYDNSTLHHIGLMESHTDTDVVITNTKGDILLSSEKVNSGMKKILKKELSQVPRKGLIIQSSWKEERYIATVTPFNSDKVNEGYVYMFKNTGDVEDLISQLNKHFLFATLLLLFFMLITIYFLSKALTRPLITMKEATTKLSKGNFSVSVPVRSKDELGELAQSIQSLANELNYLKKERNEFLASISHELRTPLTYIKGYADIARRKDLDIPERTQYLEIIHEESKRLNSLLDELFNIARMDVNTFTISKETVPLSSFLQSVYEKVLPAFTNKNIQLNLECKDNLFMDIDPSRFEQVLLNLLDNALKYSNEYTVTTIKAIESIGSISISIIDQGVGIPKADIPHVFDRLYRVEKSRARATGGFGLGLSIVKQLVEVQGGTISVKSSIEQGTCFIIIFKEKKNEDSSSS